MRNGNCKSTYDMLSCSMEAEMLMQQHEMGWRRSLKLLLPQWLPLLLLLILNMVVPTALHPCLTAVRSSADITARLQDKVLQFYSAE
jgi:hypothetical protein